MELFDASDRFTVPAAPGQLKRIRRAVRALLDYHGANPVREDGDVLTFAVSTFMISSRSKPFHRFSGGRISIVQLPDDEAEVSFTVRLSPLNIFGCMGSVVAGLLLALAILAKTEMAPWWALGAAAAGPLFAYSAKDQSVSRAKAALREAIVLSGSDRNE